MPQKIVTNLWFDTQAEEAAAYYTSIFKNSQIEDVQRYTAAGPGEEGTVVTVDFTLDGQRFVAINGGPEFTFSEAISLAVECEDQAEVDEYWSRFIGDGGEESVCGWLKDKYGLSWQIVPKRLIELTNDPDRERAARVTSAMLRMRKIDVSELEAAADNA